MAEKRKADDGDDIKWLKLAARAIILADLASGELTVDEDAYLTDEAWDHHSSLHEFRDVPFSQFARQLKIHRERQGKDVERSKEQYAALLRDRSKHAKPTTYENGKPTFRYSDAHPLLQGDVCNERHRGLTPAEFRATRPEYQKWEPQEFAQRIFQMEHQSKFVNYLETNREEKKDKNEAAKNKEFEAHVMKQEKKKLKKVN